MAAAAAARAGMRQWSTQNRLQAFPRQKKALEKSVLETGGESDDAASDHETTAPAHKLLSRQGRPCQQLRTNLKTSFTHESLYESREEDFFWFRPAHRPASKRDIVALGRLIAEMSGRFADLKPDDPPAEMLQLLQRMSAETEVERDLILTSLRMFDAVLRVKDLGSVNSTSIAKEIRNPTGMSGGLHLMLNTAKEQTRQLLVNDVARQVGLKQAKQRANEKFQKTVTELRLSKAALGKNDELLLQMRHKAAAEKKKDEDLVCARYDMIASSLDDQRRFWASWRMHDGPANESYRAVSSIFSDRRMRKANKEQRDPAERAQQIEALAEAYADAQMRQNANQSIDDTSGARLESENLPRTKSSAFSFRDEPDPDSSRLSLQELKQRHSEVVFLFFSHVLCVTKRIPK